MNSVYESIKCILLTSLRSTEAIFVAVARSIFIVFINLETFKRIHTACRLLLPAYSQKLPLFNILSAKIDQLYKLLFNIMLTHEKPAKLRI